jgi:hypothetical protein
VHRLGEPIFAGLERPGAAADEKRGAEDRRIAYDAGLGQLLTDPCRSGAARDVDEDFRLVIAAVRLDDLSIDPPAAGAAAIATTTTTRKSRLIQRIVRHSPASVEEVLQDDCRGRGIELALRLRQSDSRTARRASASWLDRRSSCSTTGTGNLRFDRARKGLDVFRLIGWRSVEASRPPDHDGFEPVVGVRERRRFP